jgi:hypothetical protein
MTREPAVAVKQAAGSNYQAGTIPAAENATFWRIFSKMYKFRVKKSVFCMKFVKYVSIYIFVNSAFKISAAELRNIAGTVQ